RVFYRTRIGQYQRSLSEIVDDKRRQNQPQPRSLDRPPAKMSEICVERLTAGDRQEDEAERYQPDMAMMVQKAHSVRRIERGEHARIIADMRHPSSADHQEPYGHNRPKETGDPRGPPRLDGEQYY